MDATAAAYRKGKDGTDLWGWSCTHEARVVLQPFFKDVVDFGVLCRIQVCCPCFLGRGKGGFLGKY